MAVVDALKYRYDSTAVNPSNYIVDELHEVLESSANIIIANHGLMYTPGLILRRDGVLQPLLLGVDYKFFSIDSEVTVATGIETATAISLLNGGVYGKLLLTYHAVGGTQGRGNQLTVDLTRAIDEAKNNETSFSNLVDIPGGFPPSDHEHPLNQVTELNPLSDALRNLTTALTESRPLTISALELKEQDNRTMKVMGRLREDMSQMFLAIQSLSLENKALRISLDDTRSVIDDHILNHPVVTVTTTETVTTVVEADGTETVTSETVETTTEDTVDATDSDEAVDDGVDAEASDDVTVDDTTDTASGDVSGDDVLVTAGVDDVVVVDVTTEVDDSVTISDDTEVDDVTTEVDDSVTISDDSDDDSTLIVDFPFLDTDILHCMTLDITPPPPTYPDTTYSGPVDCGVL